MAEKKNTTTIVLAVILIVAVAGGLTYTLMSGDAPDPEGVPVPPVTGDPTLPVPEPTDVAPVEREAVEPADNPPLTLTALQYLPDGAQIAVGIPPITSLLANVAPFVQDLFEQDLDVEKELGLIARDMARDLGVEESDDLAAVVTAVGFDASQGAALFFDIEEMVEEAFEMLEMATEMGADIAPPDPAAGSMVLVLPVTDGEKAEASLKALASDMLAGVPTSEESVGDITITVYEDIGAYFVTDTVLALGNDVGLLQQAAVRENMPAQLRYGSAACPPEDVHEAVMLVFGDRILPMLEKATGLLAALQPEMLLLFQDQLDQLAAMYEDGADDPVIATLSVREDAIEIVSKIDTEVYPTLLEGAGMAQPLRWAQLLPENTLTFLSLGLTPEGKERLKTMALDSIPEEMRTSPSFSQAIGIGENVVDILGQEITLAMTGLDPIDFPTIMLMVDFDNALSAQILLPLIPQMPHDEPYRDTQIRAVAFPSPIQVYFAMITNGLVLSNSDEAIRGIIDLVRDEETSGFFASLEPPIAPETPIYHAFMIKPELYMDIVAPLAALSGQNLPSEADTVFETLSMMFEDVRFMSLLEDSWMVTRLSVNRVTQ